MDSIKIKIRIIDGDTHWPSDKWGSIETVEVSAVTFSDGMFWNTAGYFAEIINDEPNADAVEKPKGLPEIFGQQLKSLDIEFK